MEKIKLFQKELKNGLPLIWGQRNFNSVMTSTGAKTTKDEAEGDTAGKCVCSFWDDLNGHTMYYCKAPEGYSIVGKGSNLYVTSYLTEEREQAYDTLLHSTSTGCLYIEDATNFILVCDVLPSLPQIERMEYMTSLKISDMAKCFNALNNKKNTFQIISITNDHIKVVMKNW